MTKLEGVILLTLVWCVLTGYSRKEILCPVCISLLEKREDGKARANA